MARTSVAADAPANGAVASQARAPAYRRRGELAWAPSLTLLSGALRAADCAILPLAAILAHWLYLGHGYDFSEEQRLLYYGLTILAVSLQLNIFHFSGLYRFKRLANFGYQAGHVLLAVGILFLVLLAVLYLTKLSATYSRGWMISWSLLTAGGLLAVRAFVCPLAQRLIKEGYLARRVAVVGSGGTADRLVRYLREHHNAHLRVLGVFDDRSTPRDTAAADRRDGTIDDLCRRARMQNIDAVIVAFPKVSEERLAGILGKLKALPVDIRLCNDTLEYCLPQSSYEFCGIVPLLRLYDKPVAGWGLLAKSIEDKVLASLFLLWFGPLMLVIAALIKLSGPGPVFFKQKRYGFNNRLITVWKFRTMHQDQTDANAERLTTKDDPRVTPIGRFLRRSSLDELPQLINVLLGDMSVVGPRPHAISAKAAGKLYEEVVDEYAARHRVKPGVTGWAQVNGWRGETDTAEKIRRRVEHDLYYIDNWSILFDLKILLMTIGIVFKRENAY